MPTLYAIRIPDDPLPEATFNRLALLTDEAGRQRLKRFRLWEDALRSLVTRLTVIWYLNTKGLLPDGQLPTFGRKGKGKPTLATPTLSPPLEFNNTHEGRYVLFTTLRPDPASYSATNCIGVDVMIPPLKPGEASEIQEGISDQLTLREKQFLSGLPAASSSSFSINPPGSARGSGDGDGDELRAWALTYMWALKEGYTKAVGEGITFGMERIEVDLGLEADVGCEIGRDCVSDGQSDPHRSALQRLHVKSVIVDGKEVSERGWEYRVGQIDGHGYAVWWRGDEPLETARDQDEVDSLSIENVSWDQFEGPLLQLLAARS
ncbi:4'-phosphopantetheinyl transferase [Kwoniella heveanensis CBS 569]|nr:4'-phosphopantetheinyl transferase [Kwoniella heveanensis CBS 569]